MGGHYFAQIGRIDGQKVDQNVEFEIMRVVSDEARSDKLPTNPETLNRPGSHIPAFRIVFVRLSFSTTTSPQCEAVPMWARI